MTQWLEQEALEDLYAGEGLELALEAFEDLPHPIYSAGIAGGAAALPLWRRLRALTERTGFWPLLARSLWFEEEADDLETEDWLDQARERRAEDFFAARRQYLPARESDPEQPQGKPAQSLHIARESRLLVLLVPTRQGYEAPAYLAFGGWNSCPEPPWQVAILRHWHERYGAEPVVMDGDSLEMQVARPPQSEAEALELARDAYLYCSDTVDQGLETIDALKQSLLGSPLWYFWWD